MAMAPAHLRTKFGDQLRRAREIQARIDDSGEAPSEEDQAELDAALDAAEAAHQAVRAAEERSGRLEDLEAFGRSGDWVPASALAGNFKPGVSRSGDGDSPLGPHNDPKNTRDGRHRYNLMRAIQGAVSLKDGGGFTGLEAETHQFLRGRRGSRITRGVLIPWDAPVSRELFPPDWRFRDLTTVTGSGAITTQVMPTILELLRANLVLSGLGATFMTGLDSSFGIPRQSAATTAAWVAEGSAATASNATIDLVAFAPKTVTANSKFSRKFTNQAVIDVENFVADELVKTVSQALERAAINGSGVGAEPLGLLQNPDVPTISSLGANGGPLTWTKLLEFIGKHGQANAPLETRAFLINPQTKAKLGGTPREAGYPKYLYDFDDPASPIAGFPYAESTNVPSNLSKASSGNVLSAVLFGSWSQLIIAMWGAMDFIADPYTESTAGNVRYTVFQDADVNVRSPQCFVKSTEVSTA